MTSLIRVIDADNILFFTIHAFSETHLHILLFNASGQLVANLIPVELPYLLWSPFTAFVLQSVGICLVFLALCFI